MAHQRKLYTFECTSRSAITDGGDKHYKIFRGNLDLANYKLTNDATMLLRQYVATVHVNAEWYDHKVSFMRCLRGAFCAGSVILLLVTPIVVFCLSRVLTEPSGEMPTLLTASLAGFYGAHRSVAAWFNQRKLIGPYWKARSKLLKEIYTLEMEWRERPKTQSNGALHALRDDFGDAVRESLGTARMAMEAERDAFFANYSTPDIDFAQLSSSAASGTVAAFWSPGVTQERRRADKIADLVAEETALAGARDILEGEISALTNKRDRAANEDTETRKRLERVIGEREKGLEDIVRAQRTKQIDLATARARRSLESME